MDGEEDALSENDSESSMLPMARRRREASDEDDDGTICDDRARSRKTDRGERFDSGNESDDVGKAEPYDDDGSYSEGEEEDEVQAASPTEVVVELPDVDPDQEEFYVEENLNEEKIDMEPFLVPKFGSFYLHDDRSIDTGGRGHHRRVHGGTRLRKAKDEQKWDHDKFEEMMRQEEQNLQPNVRRPSTGFSQYNSKNQSHGRGNVKGTRYRSHEINSENQNISSKDVVRGRGPVRYKPSSMSKQRIPPSGKSPGTTSNNDREGELLLTSDLETVPLATMRPDVSATVSSFALPYPDSSASHLSVTQRKDAKPGGTSRYHLISALLGQNFAMSRPGVYLGRNTMVHPFDPNRFHFESVQAVSGHRLTNLPSHSSVSLPHRCICPVFVSGEGFHSGRESYHQLTPPSKQVNEVFPQWQRSFVQPRPIKDTVQPSMRHTVHKSSQHSQFGSLTSSEALAVKSSVSEALVSLPRGKSKHAWDGKESGIVQGYERGDLYGRCRQNFPVAPAKFPVMQFGEQHHGGLGNSEMACKETGTNTVSGVRKPSNEPDLMNHEVWQQILKPVRYSKIELWKEQWIGKN